YENCRGKSYKNAAVSQLTLMRCLKSCVRNEMRKPSVCVDANIVINLLISGPFHQQATILMERWGQTRTRLVVPLLFDYEVVSALRRAAHLKQICRAASNLAYQRYLRIPFSRQ